MSFLRFPLPLPEHAARTLWAAPQGALAVLNGAKGDRGANGAGMQRASDDPTAANGAAAQDKDDKPPLEVRRRAVAPSLPLVAKA